MAYCPHCNFFYDEDNESQPCCGLCGHPISCGCSGGDDFWDELEPAAPSGGEHGDFFDDQDFRPEYRAAIEVSLARFAKNGAGVVCIGYYALEYGICQMCGHHPIKWHYILENLQSSETMIVGSECITNYHVILQEWGYRPDYVTFPESLRAFARWILEKSPNAVIFDSGLVMRSTADAGEIIDAKKQESGTSMRHFRYVKPVRRNGQTTLRTFRGRGLTEE